MIYSHLARKPRVAHELRDSADRNAADDAVIARARDILIRRLARANIAALESPAVVRDYLRLTLGTLEREEFWCIWLDAQHRVISADLMFAGTLTQTSVYPREIVKAALAHNAAAVIFAHNHPSGVAEPSMPDEVLTRQLKDALALVDTKVLDHFIIAGMSALSFAERGLL
ncbi:MAG: JAB domain-containing protein [Hyphomicrobiales bacterium]|nr:JAB domain-containing protein [Hyphomicrobiales bacterium]